MSVSDVRSDEARADRRVLIIAVAVMLGLVLFGVGYAALFATTSCRQLRPVAIDTPLVAEQGAAARLLLVGAAGEADPDADEGAAEAGVAAAEALLGPVRSAVRLPLDAPLRIGAAPLGIASVVVTGDGAALVSAAGDVSAGATFRRPVTVVGDGISLFALVVGNVLTGQVDALAPLVPTAGGFERGTCVDTSAVGSPMSFLHDAREGQLLGLRTDEDGTDAVLELRDHVRGRVWAPVVDLPRAPAGLQGSRTSAAIGPDTVVLARRVVLAAEEPQPIMLAVRRTDGAPRWELSVDDVLGVLPSVLAEQQALRLEVASVDAERALVAVFPDVAPDALLPLPTFGPLGRLAPADARTVTLVVDLADGAIREAFGGPAPVGRDGADHDDLLAQLAGAGIAVQDALASRGSVWLLVGDVLARFDG